MTRTEFQNHMIAHVTCNHIEGVCNVETSGLPGLLPVGTKVAVEHGTLRGTVGTVRTGPSSDGYQNIETSNGTVVTVATRWMKRAV